MGGGGAEINICSLRKVMIVLLMNLYSCTWKFKVEGGKYDCVLRKWCTGIYTGTYPFTGSQISVIIFLNIHDSQSGVSNQNSRNPKMSFNFFLVMFRAYSLTPYLGSIGKLVDFPDTYQRKYLHETVRNQTARRWAGILKVRVAGAARSLGFWLEPDPVFFLRRGEE